MREVITVGSWLLAISALSSSMWPIRLMGNVGRSDTKMLNSRGVTTIWRTLALINFGE